MDLIKLEKIKEDAKPKLEAILFKHKIEMFESEYLHDNKKKLLASKTMKNFEDDIPSLINDIAAENPDFTIIELNQRLKGLINEYKSSVVHLKSKK